MRPETKLAVLQHLYELGACDMSIRWIDECKTVEEIYACKNSGWWRWLVMHDENAVEYCPWDYMDGYDMWCILEAKPHLKAYCDLSKIGPGYWASLIRDDPRWLEDCTCLEKISDIDILWILRRWPDLHRNLPTKKLSPQQIEGLLYHHPQLAEHLQGKAK